MTDEEKAQEITANDVCCMWNGGCPNVYSAAVQMAEWKDSVNLKIMEEIIKKFNDYPDNAVFGKSNIIDVLNEIKK